MIVATISACGVQEDLQGLELYGWTAALTLASFGAVPIAGKLTDRVGPRRVRRDAIYAVGLAMAATAPTMLVLVVVVVQGSAAAACTSCRSRLSPRPIWK